MMNSQSNSMGHTTQNRSATDIQSQLTSYESVIPFSVPSQPPIHAILVEDLFVIFSFSVFCPETHINAFPNQLTPSDSTLRLIDSGHAINIGCVPVLRPERDVDLIISLSYSWEPEHILRVNRMRRRSSGTQNYVSWMSFININHTLWSCPIYQVLEKTAAYCKDHDIPFPNADFASLEKEPQKEFYIFEDKENPKAPIVVHFPLVNVTYKHFKHPGMLI